MRGVDSQSGWADWVSYRGSVRNKKSESGIDSDQVREGLDAKPAVGT